MAEEKKKPAKKTAAKKDAPKEEKKEAKEKPKAAKAKKAAPKKAAKAPVKAESRSCKVGGCKRVYRAKGYCRSHYKKWRHGEFGKTRYKTCHGKACIRPMVINYKGLCEDHYNAKFKNKGMAPPPEAEATEAPAEKSAA